MKSLLLRYSTTPLSSLVYDPDETWTASFWSADPVQLLPAVPVVTREGGRLLSGRAYSHVLYSYKSLTASFADDTIGGTDSGVFTFLKNFFKAPYRYISFGSLTGTPPAQTYSNYSEVISADGSFPVEYTDEITDLPFVTLTLDYAEAE